MSRVIIIGGGPAGLTAALEFLRKTDIHPIVLEESTCLGGISRTVNYKGNKIDIGGHRFFSKSDIVMNWWLEIMPIEKATDHPLVITYRQQNRNVTGDVASISPEADNVMLVRNRKSRIYYKRNFFDYPLSLNIDTIRKLGLWYTIGIGLSYVRSLIFPVRNEKSLEEFFINRFGRKLYRTFFKSYTEKVWGTSCSSISAEWGAQRIKGLSVLKSIQHFIRKKLSATPDDMRQKATETSLIERFLYPKHGPGQMWETVGRMVAEKGGEIRMNQKVTGLHVKGKRVTGVTVLDTFTGNKEVMEADHVISTMPVKDLVNALDIEVPASIKQISDGLLYRDFITVGLLVKQLKIDGIEDQWIYIQEPDVKVGRLQIFNNWSPYMIQNPDYKWIGLEYFCNESDELWRMDEESLKDLGINELERIGILEKENVMDATVIRMKKTYPAYFGTYDRFSELREYLGSFENLFLVGRNGMHKYNNQDHSMLTAMEAVKNIKSNITDKSNIWAINTEQEYHEEKQSESIDNHSGIEIRTSHEKKAL